MPDEVTSTDRKMLYKVVFVPTRDVFFVEASGAVSAHQKGVGLAALNGIKHTGCDVHRASEKEIEEYYDTQVSD